MNACSHNGDYLFAGCPNNCKRCTYKDSASKTECMTGQCDNGFALKGDKTCGGKQVCACSVHTHQSGNKH